MFCIGIALRFWALKSRRHMVALSPLALNVCDFGNVNSVEQCMCVKSYVALGFGISQPYEGIVLAHSVIAL